jgi:hypothetical protein
MLSTLPKKKITEWIDILSKFRTQLETVETSLIIKYWEKQKISEQITSYILNLSEININSSEGENWQSFLTESHRCFKLLEMDMLFLKSSKKETTRQKRLEQTKTHLEQLISYSQKMLS